jgi:MoaA/NifB/PqqE/SkfB family radical SAM enzyme
MRAEIKPSYDVNRRNLADVLPLSAPFTLYIEPTKACNFQCFYCMHSTREDPEGVFRQSGYRSAHMGEAFYEKLAADILRFPEQPKRLVFSGLGEPLCHPRLPWMIQYARDAGFAGRIDVITNGALLTRERADALTDAGVSRIQISVQGLSGPDYQQNCGAALDFEGYLRALRYLYEHRGATRIFIKIIDALLEDERQERLFYQIFGDLCDDIFVEHLIVMQQQMGDHGGRVDPGRNLNGEATVFREVCPVVAYHLQISAEGDTFPCPVPGLPREFSLGNAHESALPEIWNGVKRRGFIRGHLMKNRGKMRVCRSCAACAAVLDPNENLDDQAAELLKRYPIDSGLSEGVLNEIAD